MVQSSRKPGTIHIDVEVEGCASKSIDIQTQAPVIRK